MSEPPSEDGHPRKRPKIYRACRTCVSSKTRCEDIQIEGCMLCRKRGKSCSLAVSTSQHPLSQANGRTPSTQVGDLQEPVYALHDRVQYLEERLRQLEEPLNPLLAERRSVIPMHDMETPLPAPRHPVENPLLQPRSFANAIRFDESMFCSSNSASYPNIIARGYISQEKVDGAFQLSVFCP